METITRLFAGEAAAVADRLDPITQLSLAALASGAEGTDDLAQLCAFGLVATERWPEATDVLRQIVRSGETTGMVGRTAFARLLLAEGLWRIGRWAESLAELSQSVTVQETVGPGQVVPGTFALLARVEAALGQADRCRMHVDEVLSAPPSIEMFTVLALSAVGLLELGSGHAIESAAAVDEISTRAKLVSEPGWLWWQGDAIEAYVGCQRFDDARRALERLESEATATDRGWALAAAARGRGLMARDEEADGHFSTALDGFRSIGAPFEQARTLLRRGHWRISRGARGDGGRDLAAARTIFDRLGAQAWSARASAMRGEASGGRESLTSHQVSKRMMAWRASSCARGTLDYLPSAPRPQLGLLWAAAA